MANIDRSEACRARHKATLIEYLSNPDNKPVNRKKLSIEVLGFADGTVLYQVFTPDEIRDIECEALDLRRKCYAARLMAVDDGLLKRAASAEGTAADAKLAFQRYEGWSEKNTLKIDGPVLQQILNVFPPEVAEKLKMAIIAKHRELT